MKKILSILVLITILGGCSTPEDERLLEEKYEKLKVLAQTPEAKKALKVRYEEALKQLRIDRKEKEEMAKLVYSEEEDMTTEILAFCDELWEEGNDYNPAKYQVKNKGFKWKPVKISGVISWITSKDDRHYFAVYYKYKKEDVSWLKSEKRSIIFQFYFEKPEDIMDFKKGQEVSIKALYKEAAESGEWGDDHTYWFEFFNPIVEIDTETE